MNKKGKFAILVYKVKDNCVLQHENIFGKKKVLSPGLKFVFGFVKERYMNIKSPTYSNIKITNKYADEISFNITLFYKLAGGLRPLDSNSNKYKDDINNFEFYDKLYEDEYWILKNNNNTQIIDNMSRNQYRKKEKEEWTYNHPVKTYDKFEEQILEDEKHLDDDEPGIIKNILKEALEDVYSEYSFDELNAMSFNDDNTKLFFRKIQKKLLYMGLQLMDFELNGIKLADKLPEEDLDKEEYDSEYDDYEEEYDDEYDEEIENNLKTYKVLEDKGIQYTLTKKRNKTVISLPIDYKKTDGNPFNSMMNNIMNDDSDENTFEYADLDYKEEEPAIDENNITEDEFNYEEINEEEANNALNNASVAADELEEENIVEEVIEEEPAIDENSITEDEFNYEEINEEEANNALNNASVDVGELEEENIVEEIIEEEEPILEEEYDEELDDDYEIDSASKMAALLVAKDEAENENIELTKEIEKSEEEKATLIEELETTKEESNETASRLTSVLIAKDEVENENIKLAKENEKYEESNNSLEDKVTILTTALAKESKEKATAVALKNEADNKISELETTNKGLLDANHYLKERIVKLEKEISDLTDIKNFEYEEENRRIIQELNEKASKLTSVLIAKDEVENDNIKLAKENEKLEEYLKLLEEKVIVLTKESEEKAAAVALKNEAENRISELDTTNKNLLEANRYLKERIVKLEKEISDLTDIKNLENEEENKHIVQESNETASKLTSVLIAKDEVENDNIKLAKKNEKLEEYLKSLEEKIILLKKEKDTAINKIEELENDNSSMLKDNNYLKERVTKLEKEIEDNTIEKEEEVQRYNRQNTVLLTCNENLEQKIAEYREEIRRIEEELNDAVRKNTVLLVDKDEMENIIWSLQKKIAKLESFNGNVLRNNRKLNEKIASMEKDNKDEQEKLNNKIALLLAANAESKAIDEANKIDDKDQKIADLMKQIELLNKKNAALEEANKIVLAEEKELNDELDKVNQENAQLKQKIEESEKEEKKNSSINLRVYKVDIKRSVLVKENGMKKMYDVVMKGNISYQDDANIDAIIDYEVRKAVLKQMNNKIDVFDREKVKVIKRDSN